MVVGVCKVTIHIPMSRSLKEKRQVVRSVVDRLRGRFDVAVAEVGELDRWQIAELGIACVSNDPTHANEILSHVMQFVEGLPIAGEVSDYEIEIVHAL